MIEKYLNKLYMQYCSSIGKRYEKLNIANPPSEFIYWIMLNKLVVNKYKEYLDFLGYINEPAAEIGKGVHDSIAGRDMEVISPFGETFHKTKANLYIYEGNIYCIYPGQTRPLNQRIILTHNPYNFQDVRLWSDVHNKGDYRISIGVYGKIHDKDKGTKISALKKIADDMREPLIDYDEMDGMYFMSLNDGQKIKRMVKVR